MVKEMFRKLCLFVFIILMFCRNGTLGQVGDEAAAATKEMVPAMFIFGDSLIDNGNNNNLASLAKANYYPYGIDFRGGPTGRFSNGYTMVDEIGNYISLYCSMFCGGCALLNTSMNMQLSSWACL